VRALPHLAKGISCPSPYQRAGGLLRLTSGDVSMIAASAKFISPTSNMLVSHGCNGPPRSGFPDGRRVVPASRQARRSAGSDEFLRDGELMVGSGTVRTFVRYRGSERGEHIRSQDDVAESVERDDGGPLSKSVLSSFSSAASFTSWVSQRLRLQSPSCPTSRSGASVTVISVSLEPSTRQSVSLTWRERAGLARCGSKKVRLPLPVVSAACSTMGALRLDPSLSDMVACAGWSR